MSNLSEEEYPLLETKEMSDRKKELEKLNKENIIQKLVGTEETLKFYIDLYNELVDKIKNEINRIETMETQNIFRDEKTSFTYTVLKNNLQELLEKTNE